MSVWVWKIGKSHRRLCQENMWIVVSQRCCVSLRTVGWVRGAKFSSWLSKVRAVFSGFPEVNCVKLVDSTRWWRYGLVVGIRDEKFHCSWRKRLAVPSRLIRLDVLFSVLAAQKNSVGTIKPSFRRFYAKFLKNSMIPHFAPQKIVKHTYVLYVRYW